MMTKLKLFIPFLAILAGSCSMPEINLDEVKENIKSTDIAFSDYSVEHGLNKAFVAFADDNAVLLKPNRIPIIGADAIEMYHEDVDDSEIILTWAPEFADVSLGGDLGYTYGFWKLATKTDSVLGKGTYLSIWKKQEDGSWKYVLDTGNSGLGE